MLPSDIPAEPEPEPEASEHDTQWKQWRKELQLEEVK